MTPRHTTDSPPVAVRDETPAANRELVREHLARELHDSVAGQLQTMLVEIELMRRRENVPAEIDEFCSTVRRALVDLRQILRDLRHLPADPALVQSRIDHKVHAALARSPRRPDREGT